MHRKIRELLGPAWLLICLGTLPACTQWHYDLGAPLAVADIPSSDRDLSLSDVLDQLGPPQRMSATGNGYVMAWEHWRIKEQTLGLSLGAMGTDIMSFDWGSARVRAEFLLLTFNRQHRLTSSTLSQWDNDMGGGRAIQPFFSPVSLVDVGDLTGRMSQHRWGIGALQTIPRGLNRDSNPETGQNGIEQRGTPTSVGQQSLEMH